MKRLKIGLMAAILLGTIFCAPSQKKITLDKENDPQYQYEKAVLAMQYGLPDEALKYVDQALSLDPRHFQSLSLQGLIQLKKGNYAESAAAFEKCLEIKTDVADTHNYLGQAYQNLGQKDRAEAEFQKAYALNGNAYAAYNLAQINYENKNLESALDYIEKAIQGSKKEAAFFNLKGIILNQLGRYSEAVPSFLAGLALMPGDVNMNINLGITYMNDKQPDKARGTFEKVLPLIKDQALIKRVKDYLEAIKK